MDNKELEVIKLHIAGATVRNTSPFNKLKPFVPAVGVVTEPRIVFL